jgi:transcriptional regulator with XRE-family HTH domain
VVDATGDFSWQEVGVRIRGMRTARGISQAELAKRAKLSAPGLFAIEKGAINPQLSSLRNIAKVLGCSVRTLITGQQEEPSEDIRKALERVQRVLESDNDSAITALFSGIEAAQLMLQTKTEFVESLYSMRFSEHDRKRTRQRLGMIGRGRNERANSGKKRDQS